MLETALVLGFLVIMLICTCFATAAIIKAMANAVRKLFTGLKTKKSDQ